jgi:hypothetical protein
MFFMRLMKMLVIFGHSQHPDFRSTIGERTYIRRLEDMISRISSHDTNIDILLNISSLHKMMIPDPVRAERRSLSGDRGSYLDAPQVSSVAWTWRQQRKKARRSTKNMSDYVSSRAPNRML